MTQYLYIFTQSSQKHIHVLRLVPINQVVNSWLGSKLRKVFSSIPDIYGYAQRFEFTLGISSSKLGSRYLHDWKTTILTPNTN